MILHYIIHYLYILAVVVVVRASADQLVLAGCGGGDSNGEGSSANRGPLFGGLRRGNFFNNHRRHHTRGGLNMSIPSLHRRSLPEKPRAAQEGTSWKTVGGRWESANFPFAF